MLELGETETVFSKIQVQEIFVISRDTFTSFTKAVLFTTSHPTSDLSQFKKNLGI